MIGVLSSALISIDRICGQMATAIHDFEPQIYGAILVLLLAGSLMFPPKDDSDQI